jgi:hypothetical protein
MSETRKAFQAGKERSEKVAKLMKTRGICSGILDQRYHECDSKGHQKPDEKENYCSYCYRHIDYESPETSKRDIDRQKAKDYFHGVNKVRAELQESGKLEIEVDKEE